MFIIVNIKYYFILKCCKVPSICFYFCLYIHVVTIVQPTYDCKFTIHWYGIKNNETVFRLSCVETFPIRGWFGLYYATFRVNTGTYSVNLYIQFKCGKKFAPKKAPNTDIFHTVVRFCGSKALICFCV